MALERGTERIRRDPGLRAEIAIWLAANVSGQVAALREHGCDALVMIDEPALGLAAGAPSVERSWDPLRMVGASWGLHVCCDVPWELVEQAEPDVLS